MLSPEKIIKEVRMTEKAGNLSANLNQYTLEVDRRANRIEIGKAVEKLFNVNVTRVNVLNVKGKKHSSRTHRGVVGKSADLKKAIVTLKEDDAIELV